MQSKWKCRYQHIDKINSCAMFYPNDYLTCSVQECVQPLSHIITSSLTGESITAAESAGATVAGSFLGGVVAGGAAALLVMGILSGSWKLKHSNGKSCKKNSEEK